MNFLKKSSFPPFVAGGLFLFFFLSLVIDYEIQFPELSDRDIYRLDGDFAQYEILRKDPVGSDSTNLSPEKEENKNDSDSGLRILRPTLILQSGLVFKLQEMQEIYDTIHSADLPTDATLEQSESKLTRVILGIKLSIAAILFMMLLCLTSFFSWVTKAWFRIRLNRILHFIGLPIVSAVGFKILVTGSGLGISLGLAHILFSVFIGYSIKGISQAKTESNEFEVLKHTSELDEEGKKPTQKISWNPFRVGYHFLMIILVGLIIGNILYIPLFLLQKHYSNEFGLLIVGLVIALFAFYIKNYYQVGKSSALSKFQNLMGSFAFLQYKFIMNLALGVGVAVSVVVFISILFVILLGNSEILKHPGIGIIEKPEEF